MRALELAVVTLFLVIFIGLAWVLAVMTDSVEVETRECSMCCDR